MKRRSRRSDDGGSSSSSSHSSSKHEKSRSSRDKEQSKRSAGGQEVYIDEPEARGEVNNEKLMVALRIRPLKQEEISRGYKAIADRVDSKMVLLTDPGSRKNDVLRKNRNPERQYIFDKAFGPESTQEEVYNETTKHLVQNVIEGYNATVFAYGATGGGKTYTMVGTQDQPGIMVRALNQLFTAMEDDIESNHKVTMSYLEIYNENIRDLLDPASGFLELREDSKGKNIQVTGLSEITTSSPDEVMRMLTKGNRERTQEPTAANKTSSRSHALLMVNYKQTSKSKTSHSVKNGRLYMIDLAGSERASNTQNKGIRLKEGAHINRSLLALGNCINALAENKTKYVNYRDSKLTRLLKEALSGNCHTVMIAHISPADRHFDESRNTLVYADRAKNISNKVRRNVLDVSYHVSQYQNIISELKGEIGRLKEKISNEPTNHGATATKQQIAELKELRDALVANFREQMSLRHRLMEIDNHILSLSMEFEKQNIIVTEWETEKVKSRSERISEKKRKKKSNKDTPKIYLEPDTDESEADQQDSEDVESGFEDNEPTQEGEEEEEEGEEVRKEEEGEEEEKKEDEDEEEKEEEDGDKDEEEKEEKAMKVIYNNSDSENDDYDDDVTEPESVTKAWEELMLIQREQQRYTDIKQDLEDELDGLREEGADLENELPSRISTTEEKEILSLLCKVHELEIDKVEMKSEGLMKEHEVRRRDLLILKYDKQRSLCDEIIQRQQKLIEAMDGSKLNKSMGAQAPMPPELHELYMLYQQELQTRQSEKETNFLSELNVMLRSPSMLSLRGPEFDEKPREGKLPPIRQEDDRLFSMAESNYDDYDTRTESRLSLSSADSMKSSRLPNIESDRDDSARSASSPRAHKRKKSYIPTASAASTPRSGEKKLSRSQSVHFPPISSR